MNFTLLLFLLIFPLFSRGAQVIIDIFRDSCPGYEEFPYLHFKDVKFILTNHTTYVSNKAVVVKDIDNDMKFEIFPTKCKSKDALDTCETYRSYKIKNTCRLLNARKTPWSTFMSNYKPQIRCPVKKGEFVQTNGTFDTSSLPNWARSYWKVKTVVKEQGTDKFIFCNYVEFQIV